MSWNTAVRRWNCIPTPCSRGQRVLLLLLVDDLITTGGTIMAGKKLLEKLGATVSEGAAIVDLPELGGSAKLREGGLAVFTFVHYEGH